MKLRSVMTILALTGAVPCIAGTPASVVITGFKSGYEQATITHNGAPVGSYPAGEFTGLLNGNAFSTFCTDIYQTFSWNSTKTPYSYELKTVAETQGMWGTSPYAVGSYSQVSKLYTTAYASLSANPSSVKSAAFQFALWELLYEDPASASYDTGSGKFQLAGGDAGTAAAKSQANTWLASLASASEGYSIQALYSGGQQDFLVATPVPEPQTYALALVSLGIVAGYAKRRRRNS